MVGRKSYGEWGSICVIRDPEWVWTRKSYGRRLQATDMASPNAPPLLVQGTEIGWCEVKVSFSL